MSEAVNKGPSRMATLTGFEPISTFRVLSAILTETRVNQRVTGRNANRPICTIHANERTSAVRFCPKTFRSSWRPSAEIFVDARFHPCFHGTKTFILRSEWQMRRSKYAGSVRSRFAKKRSNAASESNGLSPASLIRRRSHRAVIRVYDEIGDVIESHKHSGNFSEP